MVRIHAVGPSDREEWGRLWDAYLTFYETELDAATTEYTFARVTDPTVELHAAIARDDDGVAVGLVQWLPHPATWTQTDYCYLEDLFVAPEARGGGVGAALIEHVREWAAAHGSSKVYWHTAEDNATARRQYDRVATKGITGGVHGFCLARHAGVF